jgi:hypothetical protein
VLKRTALQKGVKDLKKYFVGAPLGVQVMGVRLKAHLHLNLKSLALK